MGQEADKRLVVAEAESDAKPYDALDDDDLNTYPSEYYAELLGAMMAYEQGSLSESDTLRLFQHLVDTGQAWALPGYYGRMAAELLANGEIHS
jgi:hypothetical protein